MLSLGGQRLDHEQRMIVYANLLVASTQLYKRVCTSVRLSVTLFLVGQMPDGEQRISCKQTCLLQTMMIDNEGKSWNNLTRNLGITLREIVKRILHEFTLFTCPSMARVWWNQSFHFWLLTLNWVDTEASSVCMQEGRQTGRQTGRQAGRQASIFYVDCIQTSLAQSRDCRCSQPLSVECLFKWLTGKKRAFLT